MEDYCSIVPTDPPKGLLPWLKSTGKMEKDMLIYKVAYVQKVLEEEKTKMVECKCSVCTETFYEEYAPAGECHSCAGPFGYINHQTGEAVRDGMSDVCPNCGAEVTVYHVGSLRYGKRLEEYYPLTVQAVDGHLAIMCWYVERFGDINGKIKDIVRPFEAYVTDGKKLVKLMAYRRFMSSISFFNGWEQRQKCVDGIGLADFVMPWNPDILIGTEAENCKLDRYMQSCKEFYPVTYLRIWQRHQNIENLIMQGAGALVNNMIQSQSYSAGYYGQTRVCKSNIDGIEWKQKKPSKMLGLTKTEFRIAVQDKWLARWLRFYKEHQDKIRPEDIKTYYKAGFDMVGKILELGQDPMKAIRYIERQKEKYKSAQVADLRYLKDYWDMAEDLRENMDDPEVRYPQNLVSAHDRLVEKKEFTESAKMKSQFVERYLALQKFCWAADGIEIHPARSQYEMIREGKELSHCVASYAQRVAEGKTAIFFIRRISDPETPWYTLELDEKNVVVNQNRGKRNCARTKEIEAFEEKWLERVKNIIKGEKRNERNAKSSNRGNGKSDAA